MEHERIRILFERQKEQILAQVRSEIQKHELQADGRGDSRSPRQVGNRRRRTREGPELACVQTPLFVGWHTQGGEGSINTLPWYRLVGVAIPPARRKGGRTGLPARVSGRHVVRR